jgi:hypothetical protein
MRAVDFNTSFTEEQQRSGCIDYNYRTIGAISDSAKILDSAPREFGAMTGTDIPTYTRVVRNPIAHKRYSRRLLEVNKSNISNVVHEDRDCHWSCTQKELAGIHNKISNMSQLGYNLEFYNDKSPVDSLEKPLETFVRDLNSVTIISLIIVFIVLLAMREGRISRLFKRTV